jgi:hypothetical protein
MFTKWCLTIHFATHFHSGNFERLGVDNFSFKTLSVAKGEELVKPFIIEEVK